MIICNSQKYNLTGFKYKFLILIFLCMSACSGPRTEKVEIDRQKEAESVKTGYEYTEAKTKPEDTAKDNNYQKVKTTLYSIYNEWKNTRYKKGGFNKNGIDCSAFVHEIFRTSFAQTLPRSTFEQIKVGKLIPENSLCPGDLVFFKTGSRGGLHVGIYIEDKIFLHVSEKKGVILSNLDDSYWKKTYFQSKRVLGSAD